MTNEILINATEINNAEWQTFENFELKQYVLWEHPETGASITLLDFPKGSGIPDKHSHASNQFMYCLEGKYEYTDSNLVLTKGSFYSNPKDHPHGPTIAHERSILLEIYDGPHYYKMPTFHTDKTIGRIAKETASNKNMYAVITVANKQIDQCPAELASQHNAFMDDLIERDIIQMGGLMLDETNNLGTGNIYIIAADSLDEAKATTNEDPYVKTGYFEIVHVYPWQGQINRYFDK